MSIFRRAETGTSPFRGNEIERTRSNDVKQRDIAATLELTLLSSACPNRYESRPLTQCHRQGRRRQGTFDTTGGRPVPPSPSSSASSCFLRHAILVKFRSRSHRVDVTLQFPPSSPHQLRRNQIASAESPFFEYFASTVARHRYISLKFLRATLLS